MRGSIGAGVFAWAAAGDRPVVGVGAAAEVVVAAVAVVAVRAVVVVFVGRSGYVSDAHIIGPPLPSTFDVCLRMKTLMRGRCELTCWGYWG